MDAFADPLLVDDAAELITHPKVADAAVFGVPNADLGEGGEGGR